MKKSELINIIREELIKEHNPKKYIMDEITELFHNHDLSVSEFELQNGTGELSDVKLNKIKILWKNFEKSYNEYIKVAMKLSGY